MYGLYGFMSNLVLTGKLKFTPGKIDVLGDPMAIMSMEAIKQITDDALTRGKEGRMGLYYEGWVYGYTFTYRFAKVLNLKKFEERYMTIMNTAAMIGFGDFKTIEFRPGNAHYRVLNNPFAIQYYPIKEMVDILLAGMNAGGGTVVHEMLINCVEYQCASQNGKLCEFSNLEPKEIYKLDPKFVESQLDMESLIPRELHLIESMGHDTSLYKESIERAKEDKEHYQVKLRGMQETLI